MNENAKKSARTFMLHISLIEQMGGTRVGMPVWEQVLPIEVSLTPDKPELHTVRTADLVAELNKRYGDIKEISDDTHYRTES